VRAGIRFLVHEPVLRRLTVAWVVFILGMGMAVVGDVPLVELFDAGSTGFGLLIATWGGGSVLGSLAGRRLTPDNETRWLVIGTAIVSVVTLGIALSPWFALVLALGLAMGVADGLTVVADQNIYQRRTPDAIRSRVMGAFEGAIHGTLAVAFVLAAFALPVVGPRGVYAIGSAAGLISALIMLPLIARAREVPGRDVAEPVAVEPVAVEPVAVEPVAEAAPMALPPVSGV
jgi:MFS family permease